MSFTLYNTRTHPTFQPSKANTMSKTAEDFYAQARAKAKRYYQKNRRNIIDRALVRYRRMRHELFTCPDCGSIVRAVSRGQHLKTAKHQRAAAPAQPPAPTASPAEDAPSPTDTSMTDIPQPPTSAPPLTRQSADEMLTL